MSICTLPCNSPLSRIAHGDTHSSDENGRIDGNDSGNCDNAYLFQFQSALESELTLTAATGYLFQANT